MSNFVEIKDKDGVLLGNLPVSKEGGRLRNVVYITETAQYEKPAWLKFVRARGVAGGGGGGGVAATDSGTGAVAGGGSGGGYFEKKINAADLASSETVTIGAAGTAGTAGNNYGGNGGTTSFGAHCSATGGGGGQGCAASATPSAIQGEPGQATGGDINIGGRLGSATRSLSAVIILYGHGGGSPFSGDAPAIYNTSGYAGGFGGGGAGASNWTSQPARAGSSGGAGLVIVEEYE